MDARAFHVEEAAAGERRLSFDRGKRQIQRDAFLDHAALDGAMRVWIQGVGEVMLAHIGGDIRTLATLEQRQFDRAVLGVVAIFTVVEDGYAVVLLRQVAPLVADDFETRPVPTVVEVGRPFDVTILDVVGRLGRADRGVECGLQQAMVLVPVYMGLEVDAAAVAIDDDVLFDAGMAIAESSGKHHPHRSGLLHGDRTVGRHIFLLLRVEDIDIPVVVVDRFVLEDLQRVAQTAFFQDFTGFIFIIDA